jgi:hypothetical protein
MLFSRFNYKYGWLYSFFLIIFAFVGLFLTLNKWVKFDILRKRTELYDSEEIRFAKMLFNSWDWKTKNAIDRNDQLVEAGNELHTAHYEEGIKEKISE